MIDWLKRADIDREINLNGAMVPIVLRRHPTARRLTLRMAPDGSEVRITLPRWARSQEALAFAHARTEWLASQHARIPKREAPKAGGDVLYRGTALTIEWEQEATRRPAIEGTSLRVGGALDGLEARIRRWLEREAVSHFEADMADYVAAAGLSTVPVGISRAQKRWGSCSDQKRIRINWRLIQAPDYVRRSVVAHEVAHLVHFDHSPAFHALLGSIYEGDIARADRWLKENGRSLYTAFG